MPVYQRRLRRGVRYWFKRDLNGVRLHSRAIYPTYREAEQAEIKAVSRYLETGIRPQDGPPIEILTDSYPTVLDLLNERLAWVELHLSKHSLREHKSHFRQFLKTAPDLAHLPVSAITTEMVERVMDCWVERLRIDGKGASGVNAVLKCLQSTWNKPWGNRRKDREFAHNPFKQANRYRQDRKPKYVPTDRQARQVLLAAPPEGQLLLELYAHTGGRAGEVLELQWVEVQAEQEPYSVVLYTSKKSGGNRTPRRVPIPTDLAGRLRSWRRQNPDSHFVFQSDVKSEPAPKSYRWAQDLQARACEKAGVKPWTLHSWRHWFASKLYRDGVDRARIQALLGHENASTTDRYLHEILGLPL